MDSGTVKVTVGKEAYLVRLNESIYMKMGEIYRLKNPGKILVVLIKSQVGQYTSKNDFEFYIDKIKEYNE